MAKYGFSEREIRELLERELGRSEASTTFYWENEEVEEALDMLVDAMTKVIAANNERLVKDWERSLSRPGF